MDFNKRDRSLSPSSNSGVINDHDRRKRNRQDIDSMTRQLSDVRVQEENETRTGGKLYIQCSLICLLRM